MCGFAGAVVWDERYRVSPATLARMSAAVAHRGPDGDRTRLTRDRDPITPDAPQVALAFRRLSILDPDDRSMQPFTDGRRWLVFNGEIYNFRDLRGELSDGGREWRTTGDTEVLLAAYERWGERCVDRLNGMFAFAVWDEQDRTLFLARDRMGQKPLYVAYLDTTGRSAGVPFNDRELADHPDRAKWSAPLSAVAFASDPRCLTTLNWVDKRVASVPLMDYLRWGCVSSGGWSIFAGLGQVPMGWSARVTQSRTRQVEYFDPTDGRSTATDDSDVDRSDPVGATRQGVLSAVGRQLVSDVPIGSLLSGGADSSVITSAIRSEVGTIDTFSVGFDDPQYDESPYAAGVAAHLGTRHHPLTVRPDDLLDLTAVAAAFGEPFGDSSAVPTLALAKYARSVVKVALGGDGGDELFGGYDRYRAMRFAGRIRSVTTPLPWLALAPLLRRVEGGRAKSSYARVIRFARSLSMPVGRRYSGYRRLFADDQLAVLVANPEDAGMAIPQFDDVVGDFKNNDRAAVEAATASDRLRYLPDDLLTKVDRCSMLHGLEVRSPFMDHELVQFAAGLTTDQLLKGGPKRMLREAFAADLPAWVFKRKKMGFAVPIGEWFRGPLRAMLRDTLFAADAFGRSHFDMAVVRRLVDDHESGRADHAQRLYALLMLELWWATARPGAAA